MVLLQSLLDIERSYVMRLFKAVCLIATIFATHGTCLQSDSYCQSLDSSGSSSSGYRQWVALFKSTKTQFYRRTLKGMTGCVAPEALAWTDCPGQTHAVHLAFPLNKYVPLSVTVGLSAVDYRGRVSLVLSSAKPVQWYVNLENLPHPAPSGQKHRIIVSEGSIMYFEQWNHQSKVDIIRIPPVRGGSIKSPNNGKIIQKVRGELVSQLVKLDKESECSNPAGQLTSLVVFEDLTNGVDVLVRAQNWTHQSSPPVEPREKRVQECVKTPSKYLSSLYEGFFDVAMNTPVICSLVRGSSPRRPIHWLEYLTEKYRNKVVVVEPYMNAKTSLDNTEATVPLLVLASDIPMKAYVDARRLRRKIIIECNQPVIHPSDKKFTDLLDVRFHENWTMDQLRAHVIKTYLSGTPERKDPSYVIERLLFFNDDINYLVARMDEHPVILSDLDPVVSKSCSSDRMSISVLHSAVEVGGLRPHRVTLTDPSCVLVSNGTHFTRTINLRRLECGTKIRRELMLTKYTNWVLIHGNHSDNYPISISCAQTKTKIPTKVPAKEEVVPKISLYRDFTYEERITKLYQPIQDNKKVFVSITDASQGVMVNNCFLSTSPKESAKAGASGSSRRRIYVLSRGCDSGHILQWMSQSETADRRFYFTPAHLDTLRKPNIYLHCGVTRCYQERNELGVQPRGRNPEALPRCFSQTDCHLPRLSTTHTIHFGPLRRIGPDQRQGPRAIGLALPIVFVISCAAFILGLISSLAIWMIHRRTKTLPRNAHALPPHPPGPCHPVAHLGPRECRCTDCSSGSTPCSQKPLCNNAI